MTDKYQKLDISQSDNGRSEFISCICRLIMNLKRHVRFDQNLRFKVEWDRKVRKFWSSRGSHCFVTERKCQWEVRVAFRAMNHKLAVTFDNLAAAGRFVAKLSGSSPCSLSEESSPKTDFFIKTQRGNIKVWTKAGTGQERQ